MRQLVCLSHTPWEKKLTRTQRFLKRFPDTEILFFEPSPSYEERKETPLKVCERVAPLTYVYTLPPLRPSLDDQSMRHTMNNRKLAKFIYSCMEYHRFQDVLFWVTSPIYSELLDLLPYNSLLYDCDQDWNFLPILWESTLTSRADLVFAASPGLAEHLAPCNEHIAIIPNGFHFAHYDPHNFRGVPCPDDLADIPQPVLGYVGTIWQNLNLRPLYDAVRARPDWHFVMIGKFSRRNRYLKALNTYPNFHLLGSRPTSQIPAYLLHLDAGLSFLRKDMEYDDVLSPRIYEYLACGLPVVAMYHQLHKEEYPALVESAYTSRQFIEMCEKAIQDRSLEKRQARNAAAAEADWSRRCEVVEKLILDNHLLGE